MPRDAATGDAVSGYICHEELYPPEKESEKIGEAFTKDVNDKGANKIDSTVKADRIFLTLPPTA